MKADRKQGVESDKDPDNAGNVGDQGRWYGGAAMERGKLGCKQCGNPKGREETAAVWGEERKLHLSFILYVGTFVHAPLFIHHLSR